MKLKVALAVCNYNRKDMILACIESVLSQGLENIALCVVDNASTDGSDEALFDRFGNRIALHRNQVNEGSSGGFAKSISMAVMTAAEFILVMDSDCILCPGSLSHLIQHLQKNPQTAVVGPKIVAAEPAGVIQEIGAYLDWNRGVFKLNYGGYNESVDGPVTEIQHVDYVPACCLLARSSAIKIWGNMRPDFFLYFDDIEWCTRIKRGGGSIDAIPTATAVHHSGGKNRKNNMVTYYYWRNRIHFFRLYAPQEFPGNLGNNLIGEAVRAVATSRTLGLMNAGSAIQAATIDGLSGRWGQADLHQMGFLHLDPPSPWQSARKPGTLVRRVEHVLEDANAEDASIPGLLLRDPFGKLISAQNAWRLKEPFTNEKARLRELFYSYAR